jgi:predicted metal-dependent hydrolase
MKRIIYLDGRKVVYELEWKNVKNINLRIRFDCSVYVSANDNTLIKTIEDFLHDKSAYILSALDKYAKISKKAESKHSYVTGEKFRYLGKNLRLVVKKGKRGISSDGECLTLSVRNVKDTALKERLIKKWYYAQCWEVSVEIMNEIYPVFKKYNFAMPKLTLRNMVSRWGSCRPKRGLITLNKRLIEAPRNAFEYVVMHEFIHFLYPNHSRDFYGMLSRLMPDWKGRKKLLEEMVVLAGE